MSANRNVASALSALDPKDDAEQEGPSLAESIETRRFLGREFLAWVWFESEIFEQRFSIEGFGECELWLERQITFEALTESGREKAALAGVAPSGGAEAREALRQGKMPVKAKLSVRRDEQDFALTLDANTMAISGAKIPALLKGEGDDPFFERMTLVEELEGAIESLYREFLLARLGDGWNRDVVPAMRLWMHDSEGVALERYRATRGRSSSSSAA